MRSKRLLLIVLPLLLIAGAGVFWFFSNQEGFTGSRVKNPGSYLLDIQRMNGTDLHTLELRKEDVLHIQFETEKDSLYVEITAPDGTSVYQGNGKEAADFTVNIPESGVCDDLQHLLCQAVEPETPGDSDHAGRTQKGSTDPHSRNPDERRHCGHRPGAAAVHRVWVEPSARRCPLHRVLCRHDRQPDFPGFRSVHEG